jgi:hypothetical protein
MNMKKALTAAIVPALIVSSFALGQTVNTEPAATTAGVKERVLAKASSGDPALAAGEAFISGGCIRLTADGPKWHENEGHNTVGFNTSVDPVIEPDGDLTVQLLESRPVVSLQVVPDETLAVKGVFIGGSGGVGHVTIRMRKTGISGQLDLSNPSHYNQVRGDYSNIWLTVIQTPRD